MPHAAEQASHGRPHPGFSLRAGGDRPEPCRVPDRSFVRVRLAGQEF